MATYKEIHGIAVKNSSTDPTTTGEIFYNTTALPTGATDFKTVVSSSAWFAQSPTTTQHGDGAGAGPTTACVIWTGYSPDSPPTTNATEEFNGNGWTNGGNYPVSGFMSTGGAGTLTAALGMGGRLAPPAGANTNVTGEYDGTSWTTGNNTPDARYGLAGIGSQTAAVGFGGNNRADAGPSNPDGSGTRNDTFEYDGTNWTTGNNYPISVSTAGSCGSQTAGLGAGGSDRTDGSGVNTSCTYDGTNWTAVSNINNARGAVRQSGNQTSALLFGGPSPGVLTESWDGSSWTNAPNLAGGGYGGSSGHNNNPAGNTSALLGARRDGSNYPVATEEFAVATTVTTPAAWASGGAMANAKSYRFGGGTQNAAFAASGSPSPFVKTEEYNGSTWSEGGDIGTSRYQGGSAGSQTAGLIFGGYVAPTGTGHTEEYNGSSWSEQNNLNQSRYGYGGLGTQTAALYASAYQGTLQNVTEEYDGSSWTAVSPGTQNQSTLDHGTAGTQTAGLIFGGQGGPGSPLYANAETYNGSTWTAVNTLNTARSQLGGSGTQTAAIAFGGRTPPVTAVGEQWDGTTWATAPSLATARRQVASTRVETGNAAALAFGGSPVPGTGTLTEEFTGETTAANVKTITTS
jgi:hypothetical protein